MGSKLIDPFDEFPLPCPPPGDRQVLVHDAALHPVAKIVKVGAQLAIGHRLEPVTVAQRQIKLLG
jgi:hypothetical protein